ncbi:MAG: glycosyltransferase family 2 protein [Chloroflexi bacterium]|nr:glycosyltransferase family 2 protein [Chloroflexota bacterium]
MSAVATPADSGTPLVGAVVVTWNGGAVTRACVASLRASTGVPIRIVVVDNASRADERQALVDEYGAAPDVELVLLDDNRHFAGGVNAGARCALEHGATHLLFLNNDTVLAPDCVRLLVAAADGHPEAGIVGPALLDLPPPHRPLSLGERYSAWSLAVPRTLLKVRSSGDGTPYHVGGIMGSAILVTSDCFRRVGSYSEDLLVYYEEVDYCLRARARGYRPLLVPRAVVLHDGMRGFTAGLQPYAARLKCRNQLLLLRWHGSLADWLAFVPIFTALVVLSSAIYAAKGRRDVVAALWRGVAEGIVQAWRGSSAVAPGGAA